MPTKKPAAPAVAEVAPAETPAVVEAEAPTTAAEVAAPEAPAAAIGSVTFWSHYTSLQVWDPTLGFVGAFTDGEFVTDDAAKIAALRALPECSERVAPKE